MTSGGKIKGSAKLEILWTVSISAEKRTDSAKSWIYK